MRTVVSVLFGNSRAPQRLGTTALIVASAILLGWILGFIQVRRIADPYTRYHARKITRYVVGLLALIAIAIVRRAFAGRIGLVAGLAAAGIAFAAQELIGALFGWVNILAGRIYRAGDRIEIGDVQGDVIDVTPLRTEILEMGSARAGLEATPATWVHGRQHTGRIVALSNKMTFTQPVYNYSAVCEYIWEEVIPDLVPQSCRRWSAATRCNGRRWSLACSSGPRTTGWSSRPGSWCRFGDRGHQGRDDATDPRPARRDGGGDLFHDERGRREDGTGRAVAPERPERMTYSPNRRGRLKGAGGPPRLGCARTWLSW